jgi:hypothetical protein
MNKVDLFALALRDSLNLHARLEYIEPPRSPGGNSAASPLSCVASISSASDFPVYGAWRISVLVVSGVSSPGEAPRFPKRNHATTSLERPYDQAQH